MTWREITENPILANLPYKIETNEFGQVVMSPAKAMHGLFQGVIQNLLTHLIDGGQTMPEAPIETRLGVKVADVAWLSKDFLLAHLEEDAFSAAPELCIEVISPTNTQKEITQKRKLYFEAGASEVWTCALTGQIRFYSVAGELEQSSLTPKFPKMISVFQNIATSKKKRPKI